MLAADGRWIAGSVSGGCLESDVVRRGEHRSRFGPVVVTYDSTEEGEAWGSGLGCDGVVELLLEQVVAGARHEALVFAEACFAAEATGTLVTVIQSADASIPVGTRLAVGPGQHLLRPIADPVIRRAMTDAAGGAAGAIELAAAGIAVLVERVAPSPHLFVLGSGHDAAPIVALARSIGMRATVVDRVVAPSCGVGAHRTISMGSDWNALLAHIDAAAEAYVVIKHHQRDADRQALSVALSSQARYIGVLGPARRTNELLEQLGRRPGTDPRVHAPIGLDIGAETPEQIGLAIVAEIQAVRGHHPSRSVRDRTRPLHADVAIAVLAAGGSRRLGRPKQLVLIDGVPMARAVVATCSTLQAGPVAVILGAQAATVAAALEGAAVTRIVNEAWDEGIASSIRAAVAWARTTPAAALVIVLGDQPLLTAEHLATLRNAWLNGADLVASRYEDVRGAPAVFDRSQWDRLARLHGDRGAAPLLAGQDVVTIDWAGAAVDIDTEDDVASASTITAPSACAIS